jgi:hypothetical protein
VTAKPHIMLAQGTLGPFVALGIMIRQGDFIGKRGKEKKGRGNTYMGGA